MEDDFFKDVTLDDLPEAIRDELDYRSYCEGWTKRQHLVENKSELKIVLAKFDTPIDSQHVMVFCESCYNDFWSTKNPYEKQV